MSHYMPQPRYSAEHKEQAKRQNQPLFTLDINGQHLDGSRMTTTGVLCKCEALEMIERLMRMIKKYPDDHSGK